jgi:rSAM/selenodomain-associated transferase 1
MIIVFAKAPVPGQAKTRLIPRLGAWRAARLHARLTRLAVETALAAGCGQVELHGTARHSFFSRLKTPFRLQRGRDLGERMCRALESALRRHPIAILVGTDCPMLSAADLRRAARWLRGGCDAVLAPAEDGGYALIGLKRGMPQLFQSIDQQPARGDTVKKLAGYRWRALRRVWDVDRPEDLERLRSLRFASASRRGAPRSLDTRARWGGSGPP